MLSKCVVACINADGIPDFFYCKVKSTKTEYAVGLHRKAAEAAAVKVGYKPFLVYDETNDRRWLFEHFDWRLAHIFVTEEMQEKENLLLQFVRLVDAIERVKDWRGTPVGDMLAAVRPFLISPE